MDALAHLTFVVVEIALWCKRTLFCVFFHFLCLICLFSDNGKAQLTKTCPGTITNWVINAFAVNSNYGVGVAPTKEVRLLFQ